MRNVWRLSAALSLATIAGSLGCSSGSSWLSSPLSLGKSRSGSKFADAPSFNQNYDELAAEQRDRKYASPALGLGKDGEPGTMKKLSNSVTNNRVAKGIKSAWNKTTKNSGDMFTTRKGPPPSSISLSVETGAPDAQLHVAMARLEESKGNFVGAEKKYVEALDDDPAYLEALVGLARLHDRQGNLTKATAYYSRAVKAHPRDATAHNDLGLCYARQNRLQDAAQSLDRAAQLAPDKPLYRNNIAKVLVEMGQIEPAIAHLTVAHGEAVAHYNVGYMLYERGETAAAIAHFSMAYERDRELTAAYDWAVALENETTPMPDEALAANDETDPAAITATDNRLASQLPDRSAAPSLSPSWSNGADRSTYPAAAPSPDGATGYVPSEPDPATYSPSPADMTHRLPPIDTAYRAPSRY